MRAEEILPDYERALNRFQEAMQLEPPNDVHRAGCIQYFEFTFDLAWKSIQSVGTHYGLESVKSPRAAFKTAFSQGWITNQEPWLSMLESRNRMSHVYSAEEALGVYENLDQYIVPFKQLHEQLCKLMD